MQASFASQASVDPLRASAERAAEAALHELPEALVLAFDERLRVERVAGPAQARVGGAEEGAGGRPLAEVFAEHAWRRIEPLARSALRGETRSREIWTSEHGHCLTVDVGPLQGARADVARAAAGGIALVLDATARRRAEMLRGDGDGAPVGTGLLDMEDRWVLANRALCDITGYTADELIGKRFEGIVHPDDAGSDRRLRERLLTGELPAYRVEKRCFDAAGETVSTIMSLALVRAGDGTPLHYVAQVRDVSERRRLEEDLRGLGDHDPLTGVRNRRLFGHDLRLQLARCRRYGEVAGLMVVELQVAGARGEQALERVVGAAARALTRRLRETDLIARVDAERFAVLLAHVDEEGLAVVAESVQRVIAGCAVEIGDDVVHPSARVGFVLLDERERGAEQALERVEQALRGAA
ncbi:MAG TPA: PAS domain S-box protein [Solirubrobacteraceae bacterium]|nr:PAS domain S-box protein [Solirubrobacteraceae bacterium]